MSTPNWTDLLPKYEAILAMPDEAVERAQQAADHSIATLSLGIAGIGNLLAGAADNHEKGLSEDSMMNVFRMLESLGRLMFTLHEASCGLAECRTVMAAADAQGGAQ